MGVGKNAQESESEMVTVAIPKGEKLYLWTKLAIQKLNKH